MWHGGGVNNVPLSIYKKGILTPSFQLDLIDPARPGLVNIAMHCSLDWVEHGTPKNVDNFYSQFRIDLEFLIFLPIPIDYEKLFVL